MLYSSDALALLIKTVGADRCLFGTERPGVGTVKDPDTGKWMDETRYLIEAFDWLSAADKKLISKIMPRGFSRSIQRVRYEDLGSHISGTSRVRAVAADHDQLPAKAPANWPLFLAKEGGYYQKYGSTRRWSSAFIRPASR